MGILEGITFWPGHQCDYHRDWVDTKWQTWSCTICQPIKSRPEVNDVWYNDESVWRCESPPYPNGSQLKYHCVMTWMVHLITWSLQTRNHLIFRGSFFFFLREKLTQFWGNNIKSELNDRSLRGGKWNKNIVPICTTLRKDKSAYLYGNKSVLYLTKNN